jgi:hypothetical protein
MKTLVCNLQFTDGQYVSATVSACSANQEASVTYCGAVHRLGLPLCQTPSLDFLEWYLQARAFQLQAKFNTTSEGDFGPPLRAGFAESALSCERSVS